MIRIISSRKKQGQFIAAPVVSGDSSIGSVLSVTNGVFDGPTSTYTYQWFLEGSPISGATANTYTLPDLSNGILRCVVKATNGRGSVKSTSNFFTIRNSFNFVIKTDNVSTGSSTTTQFKLPLVSTGTYNCKVYWGDGTSDTITTWNQAQTTHTYATSGTYNVYIAGNITGWTFNNTGDRLKILSVGWWGPLRPGNNTGIFMGCGNLMLDNVRDVLDTTGMTSFSLLFQNCISLVRINRVNEWNTSSITNMGQVFDSCINFNDNIGNWNMSNVTTFDRMFAHAGKFNNGGSPDINNWDTANVTFMRYMFGTDGTVPGGTYTSFNQPIGNWNTSKVTNMNAMFFRNSAFNQDIGTKAVTKNNITYTAWNTSEVTDMAFMFGSSSNTGVLTPRGFFNNAESDSIKNWNTSKVIFMNSMFSCQLSFNQDVGTKVVTVNNITYTAWDVSNVTAMSFMFNAGLNIGNDIGVFNNGGSDSIKNWNTSKVTTLVAFCQRQALFNQDIGTKVVTVGANTYTAWDIGNVTSLSNALSCNSLLRAGAFNNGGSDSIKNWNTSKVTSLNATFNGQAQFNQDISTKRVTVGASTYTAWDTLNVTTMSATVGLTQGVFTGIFNQNIGNWNTSKVTTMSAFAFSQSNFNQDISTKVVAVGPSTYTAWDTLNVTNISFMLGITPGVYGQFNQNIGNWNTSKVTTISAAFQNQPIFNQNVSTKTVTVGANTYTSWDMLNVTTMRYTFYNNIINPTSQFNQNIGNWNTVKVTDMGAMLGGAASFNQNISNWNVSLVTTFDIISTVTDTFADRIGLSTANYDALLIGWATRPVKPNLAIGFGTTKYSSTAIAARAVLTSAPNNWTIIDGGQI